MRSSRTARGRAIDQIMDAFESSRRDTAACDSAYTELRDVEVSDRDACRMLHAFASPRRQDAALAAGKAGAD